MLYINLEFKYRQKYIYQQTVRYLRIQLENSNRVKIVDRTQSVERMSGL